MKKNLILVVLFLNFVLEASTQQIISLNHSDNGIKTYVASEEIHFQSGYSFKATYTDKMHAYIDPLLITQVNYSPLFDNQSYNQSQINTSLEVGIINGNGDVSQTGAGIYNVPIELPLGTNSMMPNISVSYNSHVGNGILGLGWNLTGLSDISLVPKNIHSDNIVEGILLDGSDKFALDGNRLVNITGNYGDNNTIYYFENENFSRVFSYGSSGNGPAWFKVETKEGQTIEFGKTENARIKDANSETILTWKISKIYDQLGNYIIFNYRDDTRAKLISNIQYTGNENESLLPYNKIQFSYSSRYDVNESYLVDNSFKSENLLSKIEVYSDAQKIKTYRFEYAFEQNSFLKKIRLFGADNGELNPTIIKYYPKNQTYTLEDISIAIPGGTTSSGDYNSDGKSDLIVYSATNWNIYTSNGNNTFSYYSGGEIPPGYSFKDRQRVAGLATVLDFFGDGNEDVLLLDLDVVDENRLSIAGIKIVNIVENNGIVTNLTTDVNQLNNNQLPSENFLQIGDFDGDGKSDILATFETSCEIYSINNDLTAQRIYDSRDPGFPTQYHKMYFGDFNGDGKSDFLTSGDNGMSWWIAYSTGKFFIEKPFQFPEVGIATVKICDYNGDGKSDILKIRQVSNRVVLSLYTSDGTIFTQENLTINNTTNPNSFVSGDFNGDGKIDEYRKYGGLNQAKIVYFYKNSQHNLVEKIKNGFGQEILFNYTNLAQLSDYTDYVGLLQSPLNRFIAAIPVVTSLKTTNGVGNGNSSFNEVRYR